MLEKIDSIINGNKNALDKDKAFTFIEFIKAFGFENNPDSFFVEYKQYLNDWADVKSVADLNKTKEEYVREKMADTLKSITLNYSSYEEQDFIAHIDWTNQTQIASLIPLYVRKIIQICEFYRKKRNEAPLIVKKHNTKGSVKSIEQIVYDKIVDFVFENRNLLPQYINIRRDLSVSVESFVDTYSEYFDIPRNPELSDKSRADVLGANMNDVDYRDYLKIADVVSDILYSGEMYLNEIPLIASVGLNFADECMGDLLDVKNELLSNAVVNLVPLSEQVDLRRRLYEKYLGCDLYYIYADANLDTYTDVLCRAVNPSGNLLNCATADTATTPADSFELLSHIGLHFKPDKCGVLKINAKSYTWEIDKEALSPETVYVFPDPWHYGDIGTNKSSDYPLLMSFDLDYDIKNFSSGEAKNDPIVLLGSPGWRSYYSKQDDIFALDENKNYDYAFTSLANMGYLHSYQTDVYGNQFGLFKGVQGITDKGDYIEVVVDDNIGFSDFNYIKEENTTTDGETEETTRSRYLNFNGGYFVNPTYKRKVPFDFNIYNYFDEHYKWTGMVLPIKPMMIPSHIAKYVKCSKFKTYRNIEHKDNYRRATKKIKNIVDNEDIVNDLIYTLFSHEYTNKEIKIVRKHRTAEEVDSMPGKLFTRDCSSNTNKPCDITELMPWLKNDSMDIWNTAIAEIGGLNNVISFDIMSGNIAIETENAIIYIPYNYDGAFTYDTSITRPVVIYKTNMPGADNLNIIATRRLFDENTNCQYILQLREVNISNKKYLFPFIYKFNPKKYEISEVIDLFDIITEESYSENDIRHELQIAYRQCIKDANPTFTFDIDEKIEGIIEFLNNNAEGFSNIFLGSNYNLENFAYNDCNIDSDSGTFVFTKNSALDRFLICYIGYDSTDMPYLFEHIFKALNNTVINNTIVTNVYSVSKSKDNDGNDVERQYIYADDSLENNEFFERLI